MSDEDYLMSVARVADELKCSIRKAYDIFKRDDFPSIQIDGLKRVRKSDFDQWVDSNKKSAE